MAGGGHAARWALHDFRFYKRAVERGRRRAAVCRGRAAVVGLQGQAAVRRQLGHDALGQHVRHRDAVGRPVAVVDRVKLRRIRLAKLQGGRIDAELAVDKQPFCAGHAAAGVAQVVLAGGAVYVARVPAASLKLRRAEQPRLLQVQRVFRPEDVLLLAVRAVDERRAAAVYHLARLDAPACGRLDAPCAGNHQLAVPVAQGTRLAVRPVRGVELVRQELLHLLHAGVRRLYRACLARLAVQVVIKEVAVAALVCAVAAVAREPGSGTVQELAALLLGIVRIEQDGVIALAVGRLGVIRQREGAGHRAARVRPGTGLPRGRGFHAGAHAGKADVVQQVVHIHALARRIARVRVRGIRIRRSARIVVVLILADARQVDVFAGFLVGHHRQAFRVRRGRVQDFDPFARLERRGAVRVPEGVGKYQEVLAFGPHVRAVRYNGRVGTVDPHRRIGLHPAGIGLGHLVGRDLRHREAVRVCVRFGRAVGAVGIAPPDDNVLRQRDLDRLRAHVRRRHAGRQVDIVHRHLIDHRRAVDLAGAQAVPEGIAGQGGTAVVIDLAVIGRGHGVAFRGRLGALHRQAVPHGLPRPVAAQRPGIHQRAALRIGLRVAPRVVRRVHERDVGHAAAHRVGEHVLRAVDIGVLLDIGVLVVAVRVLRGVAQPVLHVILEFPIRLAGLAGCRFAGFEGGEVVARGRIDEPFLFQAHLVIVAVRVLRGVGVGIRPHADAVQRDRRHREVIVLRVRARLVVGRQGRILQPEPRDLPRVYGDVLVFRLVPIVAVRVCADAVAAAIRVIRVHKAVTVLPLADRVGVRRVVGHVRPAVPHRAIRLEVAAELHEARRGHPVVDGGFGAVRV